MGYELARYMYCNQLPKLKVVRDACNLHLIDASQGRARRAGSLGIGSYRGGNCFFFFFRTRP